MMDAQSGTFHLFLLRRRFDICDEFPSTVDICKHRLSCTALLGDKYTSIHFTIISQKKIRLWLVLFVKLFVLFFI